MQDIKARWKMYREYGRRHGLSLEDAEDFAQDVALLSHVSSRKPQLHWCYVNFMRSKYGRAGGPKARMMHCSIETIPELTSHPYLDLKPFLGTVIADMIERFADYFGISETAMQQAILQVASKDPKPLEPSHTEPSILLPGRQSSSRG